ILVYRDPDAAGLSTEHQAYLTEGRTDRGPATAVQKMTLAEWGGLFARRTTWSMIFGFFGSVYLTWVFITWLPGYGALARELQFVLIKRGYCCLLSAKAFAGPSRSA
ncbi:MAG TPA: hypothetical protein VK673_10410, partial [Chthoniobacterales bacterium]|nr:hypothetical protein [Chthoniobacterales bacterium]